MTPGDNADIVFRIRALLPRGWFTGSTPALDGTLSGIAASLAGVFDLTTYARLQTRIASATDAFLDLISFDFFGGDLPRKSSEPDPSFRARIQAQILLERGTRAGMIKALTLLTGRTPVIFEPLRAADTKAYNSTAFYNNSGAYGSPLPYQCFVTAYRPYAQNPGYISYYGKSYYNNNSPYTNVGLLAGSVNDQDIINTINSVKPEGTVVWVRIIN